MQIPLLGEVTPLRALFLFLFFYSNDSNSLGTWSTFGAGMLLSNLASECKSDRINWSHLAMSAGVTFSVLIYASLYLEQMRMMIFLSLQSLFVPLYKYRMCRVLKQGSAQAEGEKSDEGSKREGEGEEGVDMHVEISWQRLFPALLALMVFLYLWDGLSGLTSGTLFLIVMPEFTARLKGKLATIGFFLLVILISAPIGALVIGAMYFEREMMEVPEQYKSTAKWILGARPESVPDYYSIIGVRRGADAGEIKKQFRELSKIYHPDKTAGNPELQQRFVQISEAVRKLTGKATDRAAYYKELETAELTDMVTRSVYYCLLFGLWFLMTVLAFLGNRKQQAAGGEGEEGAVAQEPKPKVPRSKGQKYWLLLSLLVYPLWLWVEAYWKD